MRAGNSTVAESRPSVDRLSVFAERAYGALETHFWRTTRKPVGAGWEYLRICIDDASRAA